MNFSPSDIEVILGGSLSKQYTNQLIPQYFKKLPIIIPEGYLWNLVHARCLWDGERHKTQDAIPDKYWLTKYDS